MTARWLPDGFRTITPNIIVEDAERTIDFFCKRAVRRDRKLSVDLILRKDHSLASSRSATRSLILGSAMEGWPGARLDRTDFRRGTRRAV